MSETAPTAIAAAVESPSATQYRPSALWTVIAVLWWLFTAYPAAVQQMDNNGDATIVSPLIAILLVSAVVAGLLRLVYVAAFRKPRVDVMRVALTSPWMWVIAGFFCMLETLGQVGRS